ncbi:2-polyprenyl-6-methoxyphenol hydroxylase-like FAD-dependent oxidoreductase [Amorphus suaedae]
MAKAERVLVVGAGPVGLSAALALGRSGFDVRIVDQSAEPSSESRAAVVNARTLELLDYLGVAADLIDAGVRLDGLKLVAGYSTLATVDMTRLRHPFNFILGIPQSETEAILDDHLAFEGISVERGTRVSELYQDAARVHVTTTHGYDRHEESYDWVLGADGAHSTVRKALSLDFAGEAYPFQWSLADIDIHDGASMEWGELRLDPGRPMLLRVPIASGRHRLISNVPNVLDLAPPAWQLGALHWSAEFAVSHRHVATQGKGRVWLAGDAAHIHSPAGGRGMNLGIEDAVTFARFLSAGRVAEWATWRWRKAATVLKESDRMQRFATSEGGVMRRLGPKAMGVALKLPALHRRLVTRTAGLFDLKP